MLMHLVRTDRAHPYKANRRVVNMRPSFGESRMGAMFCVSSAGDRHALKKANRRLFQLRPTHDRSTPPGVSRKGQMFTVTVQSHRSNP